MVSASLLLEAELVLRPVPQQPALFGAVSSALALKVIASGLQRLPEGAQNQARLGHQLVRIIAPVHVPYSKLLFGDAVLTLTNVTLGLLDWVFGHRASSVTMQSKR